MALARKNALFAGHDDGAENWAIVASLIETCKLGGIDPYRYLPTFSPASSISGQTPDSTNSSLGTGPPSALSCNAPLDLRGCQASGPRGRKRRLQTIATWQAWTERKLTREDGRKIIENVSGFFSILQEWSEKRGPQNAGTVASSNSKARRHTRQNRVEPRIAPLPLVLKRMRRLTMYVRTPQSSVI